jgi:hypothetical protein
MAARLNTKQDEKSRSAIKTTQLVKRLQGFALSELDKQSDKPVEMSPAQVKAALGLLKKTIPDLQSTELSGSLSVSHEDKLKELE